MKSQQVYDGLFEYVKGLEIIDTHEHLPAFEELRERDTDILKEYLTQYFNSDLISAGLSIADYEGVINNELPLMERWKLVEPYWEAARNTGYGRVLDISAKALYGIEKISGDSIEELNGKFLKSLEPGHFEKVLKEKSKIKISLLHDIPIINERIQFTSNLECDQNLFRNVFPVDYLIFPQDGEDIARVEHEFGRTICSFEDWLEASEAALDNALNHGAVALKSGLAYHRSIGYERTTRHEAEVGFNEIFSVKHRGKYLPQVFTVGEKFQNYMMHFILGMANRRNLTFQFHTGIQEGYGNLLYNSDPSLLAKLFLESPDVDFDLFHIGYPYQNIVSALSKNFQNVYIDMCWAHIISPEASINALTEWIDSVPLNKISAFGGDYFIIDAVYGHQYMARVNVCRALTKKVEEDVFDIVRAKEISKMLFYNNPLKIFKLSDRL